MKTKQILIISLALMAPRLATAESLEEKKKRATQEEWLAKATESMNKKCETKIEATFDWKTFQGAEMGAYSENGRCSAIQETLQSMCGDKDAKEAIQKSIKKIVCHFGGKEAAKRSIQLKGGTLDFTLGLQSSNEGEFIKAYLMKNL